ncbi:MAG: dihydroorotase [Fibrobacterota bacterium]|nr:dihydroorotase [Fibrobacterota bacterium]QQS03988.1 MAG: dihydroorotase [Fibrobacterota bacterium]
MSEILLPGFCDLGCAFGEPGSEQAETIASGLAAATRGGFSVVAMEPFTEPAIDSDAQVHLVRHRAAGLHCDLLPLAAATRDKGTLSEMALLAQAGAAGVSLGDTLPRSTSLLRSVLEYAAQNDLTVFVHPCDPDLAAEGIVHEGPVAERLGLRGIPSLAEEIGLGTLLPLVRRTKARVHLSRISSAVGVSLVREAKLEGLPVTADVSFRHLLADESILEGFPEDWKVFPPLRGATDRTALWAGLRDGSIDAICSLHRPVAAEVKSAEFDKSPYGAIGLETCFPALLAASQAGTIQKVDLADWVKWLSTAPRKVLGLDACDAQHEGTWWDLAHKWTPSEATLASRSSNCPEMGVELLGKALRLRRRGTDLELPALEQA